MNKKFFIIIACLLMIALNGCLTLSEKNGNSSLENNVTKSFGEITLETIKQSYINQKYLFIEESTEFADFEKIDLNNVYTVIDVNMKTLDETTVVYVFSFEKNGTIREQEYGQLFQNVQKINFFEYKYFIIGDTTVIENDEIDEQYDRRNRNSIEKQKLLYRAYYPLESFMIAYDKFKNEGVPEFRPQKNYNVNKLIALLVNPMAAGSFGQFSQNEDVMASKGLLRVIDLQHYGNTYNYLVAINDTNIEKPFYIIANRALSLMNFDYANTIFEDLWLRYKDVENYYSNGIPNETFVFQLVAK